MRDIREWKFADIYVSECEYDGSLHCFKVYTDERYLGGIYPNSMEDMEACIADLDAGKDPITEGWEDGCGNVCDPRGWGDGLRKWYYSDGLRIEECLSDNDVSSISFYFKNKYLGDIQPKTIEEYEEYEDILDNLEGYMYYDGQSEKIKQIFDLIRS